jgi:hypothetical protein
MKKKMFFAPFLVATILGFVIFMTGVTADTLTAEDADRTPSGAVSAPREVGRPNVSENETSPTHGLACTDFISQRPAGRTPACSVETR